MIEKLSMKIKEFTKQDSFWSIMKKMSENISEQRVKINEIIEFANNYPQRYDVKSPNVSISGTAKFSPGFDHSKLLQALGLNEEDEDCEAEEIDKDKLMEAFVIELAKGFKFIGKKNENGISGIAYYKGQRLGEITKLEVI